MSHSYLSNCKAYVCIYCVYALTLKRLLVNFQAGLFTAQKLSLLNCFRTFFSKDVLEWNRSLENYLKVLGIKGPENLGLILSEDLWSLGLYSQDIFF